MDGGEKVGCELVVASGDAAEVLQASEHALDCVASSVESSAERRLEAPVRLGRDVWGRAAVVDGFAHGIGVVAAVGDQQGASRQQGQERKSGAAVGRLTAGQREGAWAAKLIGQRVDLGRAPAAADADCLRPFPPFPPAAQRWAFIVELSSSSSAGGPPASASA